MKTRENIVWSFISLVASFGCSNTPGVTPLYQVTKTLEKVAQQPLQTKDLCMSIEPEQARNECVLIGVDKLSHDAVSIATDLCSTLQGNAKGECWFRLAERHDKADFCKKAVPFEIDCTLHLLSRWLFRHPDVKWTDMVQRASLYGVDSTSIEGETVLYRHLISIEQPIQLQICTDLPNPIACVRAGQSIYRDRLRFEENQGTFPCNVDNVHPLSHANQSKLHKIYTEFHNANCSD